MFKNFLKDLVKPTNTVDEDNEFGEILGKLKDPPTFNPRVTKSNSKSVFDNIEPEPNKVESEKGLSEPAQEGWDIDEDLDLDIPEIKNEESVKEEVLVSPKENITTKEEVKFPFISLTKTAANLIDSILPIKKEEKPIEEHKNEFKDVLDLFSQKDLDEPLKPKSITETFFGLEAKPKSENKDIKALEEEIIRLKLLNQRYMEQAAQVEILSRMEQEIKDKEYTSKMEDLNAREIEINHREAELTSKEQNFKIREEKLKIKENLEIDETYLDKLAAEYEINKEKLERSEQEVSRLKTELISWQTKYDEDTNAIRSELNEQNENDLSTLRDEMMEEFKRQKNDFVAKITREMEFYKSKNVELKTLVKTRVVQLESIKNDMKRLTEEVEELIWEKKDQIFDAKNFIQGLKAKVSEITKNYQSKLAQLESNMSKVQASETKLKEDQAMIKEEYIKQIEKLNLQNSELQNSIQSLMELSSSYKSKIDYYELDLKSKAFNEKEYVINLENQLKNSNENESKLKNELKLLQEDHQKAFNQKENHIKQLETKISLLEEELSDEKEKVLTLQLKLDELEERYKENQLKISLVEQEKKATEEDLYKELQKAKAANFKMEEEYLKEIETLRTTDTSDTELLTKYNDIKSKLDEVIKEREELRSSLEVEFLRLKDEYDEKFKSLNSYIEQLYMKNHELSEENNRMSIKFQKLKEKLATLDYSFKNSLTSHSLLSPRTEIKQLLAGFNFLSSNSSNATPEKIDEKEDTSLEKREMSKESPSDIPEVKDFNPESETHLESPQNFDKSENNLLEINNMEEPEKIVEVEVEVALDCIEEEKTKKSSHLRNNQPEFLTVPAKPEEDKQSNSEKAPSLTDIPHNEIKIADSNQEPVSVQEEGWGDEEINLDIPLETNHQIEKPPSFNDIDSPRKDLSGRERQRVDSNASFSHDNNLIEDEKSNDRQESPKFENQDPMSPKFENRIEPESPKFDKHENTQDKSVSREFSTKRGGITQDSFSNIEDQNNDGWDDVDNSTTKDNRLLDKLPESPKFDPIKDSPGFGTDSPNFKQEIDSKLNNPRFSIERQESNDILSPRKIKDENDEKQSPSFKTEQQSPTFKTDHDPEVESPSFDKKDSSFEHNRGSHITGNLSARWENKFDLGFNPENSSSTTITKTRSEGRLKPFERPAGIKLEQVTKSPSIAKGLFGNSNQKQWQIEDNLQYVKNTQQEVPEIVPNFGGNQIESEKGWDTEEIIPELETKVEAAQGWEVEEIVPNFGTSEKSAPEKLPNFGNKSVEEIKTGWEVDDDFSNLEPPISPKDIVFNKSLDKKTVDFPAEEPVPSFGKQEIILEDSMPNFGMQTNPKAVHETRSPRLLINVEEDPTIPRFGGKLSPISTDIKSPKGVNSSIKKQSNGWDMDSDLDLSTELNKFGSKEPQSDHLPTFGVKKETPKNTSAVDTIPKFNIQTEPSPIISKPLSPEKKPAAINFNTFASPSSILAKNEPTNAQGSQEKKQTKPGLVINKGLIINTGLVKPQATIKIGSTQKKTQDDDDDFLDFINKK